MEVAIETDIQEGGLQDGENNQDGDRGGLISSRS
jgi:hypothetical protein